MQKCHHCSHRLYSSLGSFYMPLLVMLFVYYQIFRVASNREQAMNLGRSGSQAMRIWRRSANSAGGTDRSKGGGSEVVRLAAAAPLRSLHLSTDTLVRGQLTVGANGRSAVGTSRMASMRFLRENWCRHFIFVTKFSIPKVWQNRIYWKTYKYYVKL